MVASNLPAGLFAALTDTDEPSLAACLLALAEPMVDELQLLGLATKPNLAVLFELARVTWNGEPPPGPHPEDGIGLLDALVARRALFAGDRRRVAEVVVEMLDDRGSFDLHVRQEL